jgi:hypothetical protein
MSRGIISREGYITNDRETINTDSLRLQKICVLGEKRFGTPLAVAIAIFDYEGVQTMNFIIDNANFVFNLQTQEVNGQNVLTSFTATSNGVEFNCYIQLVSEGEVETEFCCSPLGCTSGPCRTQEQIKAASSSSSD